MSTSATPPADPIAADILKKVQAIDQQAQELSHDEYPTAYLWRGGLRPTAAIQAESNQTDSKLVSLLSDRKHLLKEAGPALVSFAGLRDYICKHTWYVVGESFPTVEAEKQLNVQASRDPRFQFAEVGYQTRQVGYSPILVGFFLERREANELANKIRVGAYQIRRWDFGQNQPSCLSTPGTVN
jgi:hypothetical protein